MRIMKNPITFKDGVYIISVLVIFIMVAVAMWSLFGVGNIFTKLSPYYYSKALDRFLLIFLLIIVVASCIYAVALNKEEI